MRSKCISRRIRHHLKSETSRSNQAHTPRRLNSSTHFFDARLLYFSSSVNSYGPVNSFAGKTDQVALVDHGDSSTQNFWGFEETAADQGKKSARSEFTGRVRLLDKSRTSGTNLGTTGVV